MDEKKKNKYRSIGIMIFQVAFAICALIFLFLRFTVVWGAVKKFFSVLTPVFLGIVLCYLASPVYNRIFSFAESRKMKTPWPKLLATVLTTLCVLFICYGMVALIIPQLYDSITNLYRQLPEYIRRFSVSLDNLFRSDFQFKEVLETFYISLSEYLANFLENEIVPNMDKIATQLFTSVKSVAVWVYDVIIGLVVMVYLFNFKQKLLPQCKKLIYALMKPKFADAFCTELKYVNNVFGGFITGKLLDSLIIGMICFIVTTALSIPYSLLVSVLVGVSNIIPFFGPFIGAIPSAFIITMISPKQGLVFIIFIFILQQIDGNIIGPKILGDSTGLSSFWVLFSILLFGGLFGFTGMVIAVPTWALIMSALRRFTNKQLKNKSLPLELSAYEPGKRVDISGSAEREEQ